MRLTKAFSYLAILILLINITGCRNANHTIFQGYVEGDLIFLASPYSGKLLNLYVHRGQVVEANTKVFSLDPNPEYHQMKEAYENLLNQEAILANLKAGQRATIIEGIEAQIAQTQANLKLAAIRLQRAQQLFAKNAASKDYLDTAITEFNSQTAVLAQLKANLAEAKQGSREQEIKAQEFAVKSAKANYQSALWTLEQKTQFTKQDGIIDDTYYRISEFVNAGNPVASLLTPSQIYFAFFLPENLLSTIHLGQLVTIDCDSCKNRYQAKITYISPSAEYTPPVIYSRQSNYKLVYRIKAQPSLSQALLFHPGQPVEVVLNSQ